MGINCKNEKADITVPDKPATAVSETCKCGKYKICIVGGGNIGTAMLADLSLNPSLNVNVITHDPKAWSHSGIVYNDSVTGASFVSGPYRVTDDWGHLRNADMILISVPAFMTESVVNRIREHLSGREIIGFIPGSGGREFYSRPLLEKGCTIFGLDRVPFVSRIAEYGHSVSASKKKGVRCATIPQEMSDSVSEKVRAIFGMECIPLDNYLAVTFTPSNQILHPSRIYSLFAGSAGKRFPENIPFYKTWDVRSSEILLKCDDELGRIIESLEEIDLSEVVSLRRHYESNDEFTLTDKIQSIGSLSSIMSPMKDSGDGFVPDNSSRYFTEDIPFGLCILKGFAIICHVETPMIDEILQWFQKEMGEEYVLRDRAGRDYEKSAIPQKFGLNNKQDVYRLYCRYLS